LLKPEQLEETNAHLNLLSRDVAVFTLILLVKHLFEDIEEGTRERTGKKELVDDFLIGFGAWKHLLKKDFKETWNNLKSANINNDSKMLDAELRPVPLKLKISVTDLQKDAHAMCSKYLESYSDLYYEFKPKWEKMAAPTREEKEKFKLDFLRECEVKSYNQVHNWNVFAKRHLTDAMNQACGKITILSGLRAGYDMLCTTTHLGARNKGTGPENHEQWQGKPGRISNRQALIKMLRQDYLYDAQAATSYPQPERANEEDNDDSEVPERTQSENGEAPDFVEMTGLGTPVGLYGYNCRHSVFVYDPKKDNAPRIPPKQKKNIKYRGEEYTLYEMSQLQRVKEAQLRRHLWSIKQKETVELDTLDEEMHVYKIRNSIEDICKHSGLPRMFDNEKIFIRK
jgi:hypothetical protein